MKQKKQKNNDRNRRYCWCRFRREIAAFSRAQKKTICHPLSMPYLSLVLSWNVAAIKPYRFDFRATSNHIRNIVYHSLCSPQQSVGKCAISKPISIETVHIFARILRMPQPWPFFGWFIMFYARRQSYTEISFHTFSLSLLFSLALSLSRLLHVVCLCCVFMLSAQTLVGFVSITRNERTTNTHTKKHSALV